MSEALRDHARRIWHAAVDAVRPEPLIRCAMADLANLLRAAPRILVIGAGKAGAAMAEEGSSAEVEEEEAAGPAWAAVASWAAEAAGCWTGAASWPEEASPTAKRSV